MANVILLCSDLLFRARIAATARALGGDVVVAKGVSEAAESCARNAPSLVLIDLSTHGGEVEAAVQAVRSSCGGGVRVVAYGSHVDTAGLEAARAAGCDEVMARSVFVQRLEGMLRQAGMGAGG